MLVASTIRRAPPGLNTRSCSSTDKRAYSGSNLGPRRVVLAQRLGSLADLTLAGQKHQHVAPTGEGQLADRIDDRVHQRAVVGVVPPRVTAGSGSRPVQSPRHVDHRSGLLRRTEMARKAFGIQRGQVMISFRSGRRGSSCRR